MFVAVGFDIIIDEHDFDWVVNVDASLRRLIAANCKCKTSLLLPSTVF